MKAISTKGDAQYWGRKMRKLYREGKLSPETIASIETIPGWKWDMSRRTITIELVRTHLESIGWTLISEEYVNARAALVMECGKGHKVEKAWDRVKGDKPTCPTCHFRSIDTAREMAEEIGFECLSDTYTNSHVLMDWKCDKGHEFKMAYNAMRNGCRCPHCANHGQGRYTIERLQEFAETRGGNCLSDTFTKVIDHYKWECDKGHTWEAGFNVIKGSPNKKGTWCPTCAGETKKDRCGSKAIIQLDKDNNFIKEWISSAEAARVLGVPIDGPARCVRKGGGTSGGYRWMSKVDYDAL